MSLLEAELQAQEAPYPPLTDDLSLQALQRYTAITREYSDLALAERARVKRALMLYETGSVDQALLELEDEEVALRGNFRACDHMKVPIISCHHS